MLSLGTHPVESSAEGQQLIVELSIPLFHTWIGVSWWPHRDLIVPPLRMPAQT